MSSKKENQKHADSASLEDLILLPSGDHPLDLDLTDNTKGEHRETPLDISLVTDLVPSQDENELTQLKDRKEITLRSGKRHLKKYRNSDHMNVLELQAKRIIHPDMDNLSILNSFREIRTLLIQKSPRKNFVLMVVSLAHDMGATFVAVNIGSAFSYEGQKTSLLIDCNQQKPKLDGLFNTETRYGLSDYLYDPKIRSRNIIYPTGIYRMNFIPVGNRRTVGEEVLSSERMQEFIGVLKRRYADRYIILNAPPLEVSADAAIMSEVVDYIVVVVPYGRATRSQIHKAVKLLPQEKIVGIVLNKRKSYVQF